MPGKKNVSSVEDRAANKRQNVSSPDKSPISPPNKLDVITTHANVVMPIGGVNQHFGTKKTVVMSADKREEFFEQAPVLFSLLRRKPASPIAEEGKYYSPELRERKGEYFITPETFALLLYRDFKKYEAREQKQFVNTERVFEIDNNPEKICELLLTINLKDGEDLKLFVIQDAHAVPCYLRNENGLMRCYIGDSIGNAPSAARNIARYFKGCFNNPDVTIGPSLQSQYDFYSCYTFAKKMNMYFMKHGSEIFTHIDKVGTKPDDRITGCKALSIENLMPTLLKLSQKNPTLTDAVLDTTVSETQEKTLREYYDTHKKDLGLTEGYYNTSAITKRYKYFYELNETLKELNVQEISADEHNPLPPILQNVMNDFYTPPKEFNFVNVCLEIVRYLDTMDECEQPMSSLATAYFNYIVSKVPDFKTWFIEASAEFTPNNSNLYKLLLVSYAANYFDEAKEKMNSDATNSAKSLLQAHANEDDAIEALRQERVATPEALNGAIKKILDARLEQQQANKAV